MKALVKAFDSLKETTKMVVDNVGNSFIRMLMYRFGLFSLKIIKKRYENQLSMVKNEYNKILVKQNRL